MLGQGPGLLPHRLVRCEEQPGGDVGRAHAPSGIDPRSDDEPDVIAVDLAPRQAADVEQRPKSNLVRALRQHAESELGNDTVLPRQGNDVGKRPDRGNLHERGQPVRVAGASTKRLHELQRHADTRKVFVRIGAVVALRIDDRQRLRQRRVGS